MKVFVSHQKRDSAMASSIASRLRGVHSIDVYLDLIDPDVAQAGDLLGEHLRTQLGMCSHLLAVVSPSTKESWWVPWEIGIATEKEFPISTYADGVSAIPEYLKKWPYLTSTIQLDVYAQQAKQQERLVEVRKSQGYSSGTSRRDQARNFHVALKSALGQRDFTAR